MTTQPSRRWQEPGGWTARSVPVVRAQAAVSRHPLLADAALAEMLALLAYLSRILEPIGERYRLEPVDVGCGRVVNAVAGQAG